MICQYCNERYAIRKELCGTCMLTRGNCQCIIFNEDGIFSNTKTIRKGTISERTNDINREEVKKEELHKEFDGLRKEFGLNKLVDGRAEWLMGFKKGIEQGRKEAIKIIEEMKNPYPEDIFPKLDIREFQTIRINDFLIRCFSFTFDRLSAELMRRARENVKKELLNSLGDGK
jgi:hypothetical protein